VQLKPEGFVIKRLRTLKPIPALAGNFFVWIRDAFIVRLFWGTEPIATVGARTSFGYTVPAGSGDGVRAWRLTWENPGGLLTKREAAIRSLVAHFSMAAFPTSHRFTQVPAK
jgi:hypothetical protein